MTQSTSPRSSSQQIKAAQSRRHFLRTSTAIGLSAALPTGGLLSCGTEEGQARAASPGGRPDADTALSSDVSPAPQHALGARRRLGRTALEIPPVSFGTFNLKAGNEELVRQALDHGVTHFDTADSYQDGEAEATLGRALASVRNQVTVTTKHSAPPTASAAELMEALEGSLKRLQTDFIDLYLNHAVDSFERMRNPGWAEFVDRARQDGKIRAAGLSGHGPSLVPILAEAIETEWLDAVLVAYNYIQSPSYLSEAKIYLQRMTGRLDWVALQPELPSMLAKARAKGIGVMTMKTLRGARHNDLRPFERNGSTFAQAAIRWVLAQDNIDGLVITMNNEEQIREFVAAHSGELARRPEDLSLLVGYEALNYHQQCIQGCGDCADACPAGLSIPEVLRLNMYARDYGVPEHAQREYAELGEAASPCLTCDGTPCAAACPAGIEISQQMRSAHTRLTSRLASPLTS